jgi:hypothetical protein
MKTMMNRNHVQMLLILATLILMPRAMSANLKYWAEGVTLDWSDFQGTPASPTDVVGGYLDAKVHTELPLEFTWDPMTRVLTVNVQAVFNHDLSWYLPDVATPALLFHQWSYFDLAELEARELRQEISESLDLKALLRRCDVTVSEIESLLNTYHANALVALQNRHDHYRLLTANGQNTEVQDDFYYDYIPDWLLNLTGFADPEVTIAVRNEGASPIPGDYEGSLTYTLHVGLPGGGPGSWEWVLNGRWNFSFTSDSVGGEATWSHQTLGNQVSGNLLSATTPNVPTYSGIDVSMSLSGDHFIMDFANSPAIEMPEHELTFAPISVPGVTPVNPSNTTLSFSNGASVAIIQWMFGRGAGANIPNPGSGTLLEAPVTCPNAPIPYHFDLDANQYVDMEWELNRVGGPLPGNGAGGVNAGRIQQSISSISFDSATGRLAIHWEAAAAGERFIVESSTDMRNWTDLTEVVAAGPGPVSMGHVVSPTDVSTRFYRVALIQ